MNKEEMYNFLYSHLKEFIGRPNNEKTKLDIKEKLFKLCEYSIDNYKKFKQVLTKNTDK